MNFEQNRDSHIDNMKLFLLYLVAFAHNLIPFREKNTVMEQLIKIIYLFHMPLFTFLTGYLVHKSKRNVWNYIKKLLLPYLVFQLCYVSLGTAMVQIGVMDESANTMTCSVIEPSSPLYFLVCMICWRLLCEIFKIMVGGKRFKIIVGMFLALGAVLLSADPKANTVILPMFYLLPFYYFGYIANWKELEKWLEKMSWWIIGLVLIAYVGISYMVPYETILFRINIWAIDIVQAKMFLYKAVYYVAAFLGSVIVIKVIPKKEIKNVMVKSANGMIIYIGSSFLSPYLYVLIYSKVKLLGSGAAANILGITLFTFVSIEVLSWNCWKKLYDFIFGRFVL